MAPPKTSWQRASDSQRGISLILSYAKSQPLTAVAIRLRVLVGGFRATQVCGSIRSRSTFTSVLLAVRLLAVEHQDGIRPDRPKDRRQPGDHQAKISLGEVNVGPQPVDRAVAAGHGKRQEALGTPEVDVGPIDRRANRDRESRRPCRWDRPGRRNTPALAAAVAADPNKDLGNVGVEPRPGLEHADRAANRPCEGGSGRSIK